MTKRLELFYFYLLRLPQFFLIHSLFCITGTVFLRRDGLVWPSLLLLVPYTLLFCIRELCSAKWPSILLRMGAAAVFIVIVLLGVKPFAVCLLTCICLFVLLTHSLLMSTYEYEKFIFLVFIVLTTALYGLALGLEKTDLQNLYAAYVFLLAILTTVCSYLSRMSWFVGSYPCRGKSRKTIRTMLGHGYRWLLVYVAVAVCMGLTALFLPYPQLDSGPAPQTVLPSPGISTPLPDETTAPAEATETPELQPETPPPTPSGDPVMYSFDFGLIGIALLAFGTCVLIWLIISKYRKIPGRGLTFDDFDEDISEDGVVSGSKRRRLRRRMYGPEQTVRRMYVKKVREHRRRGLRVNPSDTARLISDRISAAEDIAALDSAYHKARYSGQPIEKSELDDLRK